MELDKLWHYAETASAVDDPWTHLADARVFAFGPTNDRCYQPPAMENVANFHRRYVKNSSQVCVCVWVGGWVYVGGCISECVGMSICTFQSRQRLCVVRATHHPGCLSPPASSIVMSKQEYPRGHSSHTIAPITNQQ